MHKWFAIFLYGVLLVIFVNLLKKLFSPSVHCHQDFKIPRKILYSNDADEVFETLNFAPRIDNLLRDPKTPNCRNITPS